MKVLLLILVFCSLFFSACSQGEPNTPESVTHRFALPLGQGVVDFQHSFFKSSSAFLLLHVHSNETTAAQVAKAYTIRKGVSFFQILNGKKRMITGRVNRQQFSFDPNRMFSDSGLKKNLKLTGTYSDAAFAAIQQFRDTLLSLLPAGKTIVSVHNNTNNRLSVFHYLKIDSTNVHVNPALDADDFFITNDDEIFRQLVEAGFNVVRENLSTKEDDGSLSIYCTSKGIRYINIEAQHGHFQEQFAMLQWVGKLLE